jgi:hypothetical protein
MKITMSQRNCGIAAAMIVLAVILVGGGYAWGYFNGKVSPQTPDEKAIADLKVQRDELDKKITEAEKTAASRLKQDVKTAVVGAAERTKETVTGQPTPAKPDDSTSPIANGHAKPGPGNPGLFN